MTPPRSPLAPAVDHLGRVLDTKAKARRWYAAYLAALGSRAVVDTANQGVIAWVHRRAAGTRDVLPGVAMHWGTAQVGERRLEGFEVHDGRQRIAMYYADDGTIADRSIDDRFPGRLVELPRVLARDEGSIAASVAFLAGLEDERHGPCRVHYPVLVPGGVQTVWRVGLRGARRALYDGRVPADAGFLVVDGLEGRAVGWGRTREEALAAYRSEVEHDLPRQPTAEAPSPGEVAGDPAPGASSYVVEPEPAEPSWGEAPAWKPEPSPLEPQVDPETGHVDFGTFVLRGPVSDAPPVPPRPECVPHVVLPLEPSPESPPPRGRWDRLLGELGVTRHAVRIEEPDGLTQVGVDVLGLVDLDGLAAVLDGVDAGVPKLPVASPPGFELRFRSRLYRWRPGAATHPEGLAYAGGSEGPAFDPGGLDGDLLQAMVHRFRRLA